MLRVVGASWPLFLGLALMMIGNGLQGTLIGVRATLEAFPAVATGLVMSGYYVGFVAGSVLAPRYLGRVGHVRVFAALAALASAAVLAFTVVVEPLTWAAIRVVTGLCYAGLYVVAESGLNDRATNETRGQLLGFYIAIMLGGMAGGQFLLNLADPTSFELFVLVSVLVSIAVVPILLTAGPAPAFEAPRRVGLRDLYAISPLGVVGTMGVGVSNAVLVGMGAVYAGRMGYSAAEISGFMAAMFVGGVLLQWPLGRLSDHVDRRWIITAVTFAATVFAGVGVALSGSSLGVMVLLAGVLGGLSLAMYPLCIAHTNDFLEPDQMVAASASLVLVQGIGASFGPLVSGAVMGGVGPVGYFWSLAVVHAAIGVFALYRMSRRASVPVDEQGLYAPMTSGASPVVGSVAPKAVRDSMDAKLARSSRW